MLPGDTFDRHALDAADLTALRAGLQSVPGLHRAYLVRKRLRHFPERPCYVLGFSVPPFWKIYRRERIETALQQVRERVPFPGETIIVCIDGDNYRFGRKLRCRRGARIV